MFSNDTFINYHLELVKKTKFVKYFEPQISDSKLCDNLQHYYKNQQLSNKTTVQDLMEAEERKKPDVIDIPLFVQKEKPIVKTYMSDEPFLTGNSSDTLKEDSSKTEMSTRPEHGRKQSNKHWPYYIINIGYFSD